MRTEPLKEGRTEDGYWNGFVNGDGDGPASFSRVRYSTMEIAQIGTLQERIGSEIQQPGTNHAASTPKLCYIRQVEIILVVFRILQRRCLSIDLLLLFPNVRMMQDTQALRVGGHDAVFNAIVYHLDEVASAVWPAAQVPLFGSSLN